MKTFNQLIKQISTNHVYIQTHNFPDPDALASGFGLQYLLETKGINATIIYGGMIDRLSTAKMKELFKIDAHKIEETDIVGPEDEIILVDTQIVNGNVDRTKGKVIATIDHHPTVEEHEYKYFDVRDTAGSCSSIIASYFIENRVEIPKNIAEVLLYGIKMDTLDLTRGVSQLDLDMFYKLFMLADRSIIQYLENNTIQLSDLQAYMKAISQIKVYDAVSFAYAGDACSKSLTAAISDFMLKIDEVLFSVVYAREQGGIRVSVRSELKSLNAGEIIMESLKGIGSGGGHATMAAGFVPFTKESDLMWDEIVVTLEKKTMETIKRYSDNQKVLA